MQFNDGPKNTVIVVIVNSVIVHIFLFQKGFNHFVAPVWYLPLVGQ